MAPLRCWKLSSTKQIKSESLSFIRFQWLHLDVKICLPWTNQWKSLPPSLDLNGSTENCHGHSGLWIPGLDPLTRQLKHVILIKSPGITQVLEIVWVCTAFLQQQHSTNCKCCTLNYATAQKYGKWNETEISEREREREREVITA